MELIRTHPEPSFQYFYAGIAVMVLGFCFFILNLFIGLFIVLAGIFVLLSVKGVQINPATKMVKFYFNFLFIKVGDWIPLSEFTHVVLGPNHSSKTLNLRYSSTTVRTRSYSVYLLGKDRNSVELGEFVEYFEAILYLDEIADQIGLPKVNKEELIKKIAAEKRSSRRL